MAIQIINDPSRIDAGEAIKTGLSQALGLLAQNKMSQMMQQQQMARVAPALQALGLPAEFGALDAPILSQIVKQKLQEPQQAAFAEALQGLLGGGQPAQQQGVSALQGMQQNQPIRGGAFGTQFQQLAQQQQPTLASQQQQPTLTGQQQMSSPMRIPQGLAKGDALQLAKLGLQQQSQNIKNEQFKLSEAAKEKRFERGEMTKKEQHEYEKDQTRQNKIDKVYAPKVKEIASKAEAAEADLGRLNSMVELIQSGTLDEPSLITALQGAGEFLGMDLSSLLTTSSQEFKKLSADFIKNIKDYIPRGAITNQEIHRFLDTVPTLNQSHEGKIAVINNLMKLAEMAIVQDKISDQIIAKNNDKIPVNYKTLLKQKTKAPITQLAQDFRIGGRKRVYTPQQEFGVGQSQDIKLTPQQSHQESVLESVKKPFQNIPLLGGLFR